MADHTEIDVAVLADGDALRQERLTRSLRDELTGVEGIDVQFCSPAPPTDPLHKGAPTDPTLWISLLAGWGAARVLVAAIQAWVQREQHRRVRVTAGQRTVEIPPAPTPAQERMLETFLREGER